MLSSHIWRPWKIKDHVEESPVIQGKAILGEPTGQATSEGAQARISDLSLSLSLLLSPSVFLSLSP